LKRGKKEKEEKKEIKELGHEPEPGYRKIFNIVSSVIAIYLCIILVLGFALG
jgi:hypothetical protein